MTLRGYVLRVCPRCRHRRRHRIVRPRRHWQCVICGYVTQDEREEMGLSVAQRRLLASIDATAHRDGWAEWREVYRAWVSTGQPAHRVWATLETLGLVETRGEYVRRTVNERTTPCTSKSH